MTTDEQAPVRCQCGHIKNQHLSDGRCWSSDGCKAFVPAPEETVETTEDDEPIRISFPRHVVGGYVVVKKEELNRLRALEAEPPAPDPAGEAGICAFCGHLLHLAGECPAEDTECDCSHEPDGIDELMFRIAPAPSSGTPGLTEAYWRWYHDNDLGLYAGPIGRHWVHLAWDAGAAEARAPLDAALTDYSNKWHYEQVRADDAEERLEAAERQLMALIDKYPWLATELTPPASTAAEDSKRLEEARLNESGFSFDESPVRE